MNWNELVRMLLGRSRMGISHSLLTMSAKSTNTPLSSSEKAPATFGLLSMMQRLPTGIDSGFSSGSSSLGADSLCGGTGLLVVEEAEGRCILAEV